MSNPVPQYCECRLVYGLGPTDYVEARGFWTSQQAAIDAALLLHGKLGGCVETRVYAAYGPDSLHEVATFPRTARDGGLPHDWTETWGYAFYRRVVGFARRFQLWASSL